MRWIFELSILLVPICLLSCSQNDKSQEQGADASVSEYVAKTPQNVSESHPRIVEIQNHARSVTLNDQDFWEAELEEGHVFVYIPEGEFTMGSSFGLDNERPIRKIYLDGYWMAKFPVTVGQFRRFVDDTGYITDAENGMGSWQWSEEERGWIIQKDGNWKNTYFEQGNDHPVVSVSWNDGLAYCKWLSGKLGLEFNLATAAQFEKGARGIDERRFPWGNDPPDGTRANYADIHYWNKYGDARQPDKSIDDGFVETSPVGNYPAGASPYGLMDMAGNVWEWNRDVFDPEYYATMPNRNPTGPPDSGKPDQDRENRGGGSWTDRSGHITPKGGHNLRSAARTGDEQNSSDDHLGFRIVIDFLK
jgi:formylglycine-generating enzyme required for sulfatase activity